MDEQPTPTFVWEVVAAGRAGPGRRSRHCLAHDAATGATVLFGGIVWEDRAGALCGDTWELRSGRWARVRSWRGPAARHRGAMVSDDCRGHLVLFGGQGGDGGMLGDTWTYARRRWRRWACRNSRMSGEKRSDGRAGCAQIKGHAPDSPTDPSDHKH